MKRVMAHTRSCRRKTNGGCPVCKQLIALCCYHAKHCLETKCPVPFCITIKQKLQQQQLQQRMAQAHLMQRRMAAMRGGAVPTIASTPQTLYQTPTIDPAPAAVGGKPTITTASSVVTPGNPGMPSVVLIPQRTAVEQTTPVRPQEGTAVSVDITRNFLALQQQQPRLPNASAAVQSKTVVLSGTAPNATGVAQSTAGTLMLGGDTLIRLPDTLSAAGQMQSNTVAVAQQVTVAGAVAPRPQGSVAVTPGNASSQAALVNKLLLTLKSPMSPQQHQQILSILRSSPALMASYLSQVAHLPSCLLYNYYFF